MNAGETSYCSDDASVSSKKPGELDSRMLGELDDQPAGQYRPGKGRFANLLQDNRCGVQYQVQKRGNYNRPEAILAGHTPTQVNWPAR